MLLMDGLSLFLYDKAFYSDLSIYFLNQITGHTLLGLAFMYFYAHIHRFCAFSKIAIVGMALLNIYNIIYGVFNLENYYIYAQIIIIISLLISLTYLIKRK